MLFCFLATTTDSHQAQPNPTLYPWTCSVLYIVPCERIFGGCHLKPFVCILIRISKPLSAFGLTVLFLSHLKSLHSSVSPPIVAIQWSMKQFSSHPPWRNISFTVILKASATKLLAQTPAFFLLQLWYLFLLCVSVVRSLPLKTLHWSLKENDSICSFPATLVVQSTQVYCMVQVRAWFSAVSGNSAQVVLKM